MRAACFPTCFLIVLAVAVSVPRKATAEAQPRVALAGIFKTGDAPWRRSEAIESEVTRRLRSLGLVMLPVLSAAGEPCQAAECLPELAKKVGADLAITGVVFQTLDLCTANLWVYDARSATGRSADINCQPETLEETLSPEFAEQAGRLTEIQGLNEISNSKIAESLPFKSVGALSISVKAQRLRKPLWPWDWKRRAVVNALGLSLAGLLGTSITLTMIATRISHADGTPNPLSYEMLTLWPITAVHTAAFSITLAIPAMRRDLP